jgi:hypothetical protein
MKSFLARFELLTSSVHRRGVSTLRLPPETNSVHLAHQGENFLVLGGQVYPELCTGPRHSLTCCSVPQVPREFTEITLSCCRSRMRSDPSTLDQLVTAVTAATAHISALS